MFNTEIQFFNYVTLNIFITSTICVSSFYLVFASWKLALPSHPYLRMIKNGSYRQRNIIKVLNEI